jgi:GDP-L-fucose synthase
VKLSRALVTGGCGFVGRHFVRRLLQHSIHTTIVDDLSTGLRPEAWPAHLAIRSAQMNLVEWHLVDIRDFIRARQADFDLILHCAAVVGGRLTIDGNPLHVATDLAIDADFFNWVVKSKPGPGKVVYFSSSAAYPINLQGPERNCLLSETMIDFGGPLGLPDMTYGWAKLTGEFLARHAAGYYGLDVVCYRPFSGYGEDQDFTYPFPSVVRRVGARESPIVVWGSGEQTRDFIYIDDVVDAVFATLDKIKPGEALNLGAGESVSFRQLAEGACRIIGHDAEVSNDPSKPEGVFSRVADCTQMHRWFKPRTSLDAGIAIVHEYQKAAGLLGLGRT